MKDIFLTKRKTVEYRSEVPPDLIEHEIVDIFVGKCKSTHPIELNPNEVLETKWLSLSQLRDDIKKYPDKYTAWVKIYMKSHAKDIFEETDFL
jgi:isopentenyl-diphosphate delta-isomerase